MSDLRAGGRPRAPRPSGAAAPDAPTTLAARPVVRAVPRALPSGERPAPDGEAPSRPAPRPVAAPRSRPDPGPMRIAIGMTGIAAASAIATALLAPVATVSGTGDVSQTTATLPAQPAPSVRHVTKIVQLKPGQTAPPQAVVQQAPAPKPRVVVVTTRQSGAKP